jgi:hypothetical protein
MSGRGRPSGSKDTKKRSRKKENATDKAAKSKRKTLDAINQRREGLRQMAASLLGGASATQEEAAPGGASLPVALGGDGIPPRSFVACVCECCFVSCMCL